MDDARWGTDFGVEVDRQDLESRILVAVAEERQRLSGELHDSIGGMLSGVAMELAALRRSASDDRSRDRLARLSDVVRQGLDEIRTFSFALQLPSEESAFDRVITEFAEGFARRAGLSMTVEVSSRAGSIGHDQAFVLMRVLQEALLNVHRHAAAREVRVEFACDADAAKLVVHDNGRGLDLAEGAPPAGTGLASMRKRVQATGGVLRLESGRSGTTVTACVPLDTSEARPAAP